MLLYHQKINAVDLDNLFINVLIVKKMVELFLQIRMDILKQYAVVILHVN